MRTNFYIITGKLMIELNPRKWLFKVSDWYPVYFIGPIIIWY